MSMLHLGLIADCLGNGQMLESELVFSAPMDLQNRKFYSKNLSLVLALPVTHLNRLELAETFLLGIRTLLRSFRV